MINGKIFNLAVLVIAIMISIPMGMIESEWPTPSFTYGYFFSIFAGGLVVFSFSYYFSNQENILVYFNWKISLLNFSYLYNSMILLGVIFLCSGVLGLLVSFFLTTNSAYGVQAHFIKLGTTVFIGGNLYYFFKKLRIKH